MVDHFCLQPWTKRFCSFFVLSVQIIFLIYLPVVDQITLVCISSSISKQISSLWMIETLFSRYLLNFTMKNANILLKWSKRERMNIHQRNSSLGFCEKVHESILLIKVKMNAFLLFLIQISLFNIIPFNVGLSLVNRSASCAVFNKHLWDHSENLETFKAGTKFNISTTSRKNRYGNSNLPPIDILFKQPGLQVANGTKYLPF